MPGEPTPVPAASPLEEALGLVLHALENAATEQRRQQPPGWEFECRALDDLAAGLAAAFAEGR